ncbi:sporulation protein YpjB [Longirhabdus pacifica]|uniref:sporulation protein YpjB n=1 Tax=Longirhabdus pacifica TaxID=2305227 RepID=UPI0010088A75|nr:sporulation protein YpjB [Longirhabdus pacifica]
MRLGFISFMIITILLLFGCSMDSSANIDATKVLSEQINEQGLKQLEQQAQLFFNYVMSGEYEQAHVHLQLLRKQATRINFDSRTGVEGMQAFTSSIIEAQKIFANIRFSPEQAKLAATQVRYAVDSLTHAERPMWMELKASMSKTAKLLVDAVRNENVEETKTHYVQLKQQYQVLRPALAIYHTPQTVQKSDSLFIFFEKQGMKDGDIDFSVLSHIGEQVHAMVEMLFSNKEDAAAFTNVINPNPIVWIVTIGLFIVMVLTYTAWRKYKHISFLS